MPLLRKVAVDVCDAKDGDFDLPDVRPLIRSCIAHIMCSSIALMLQIQTPFFLLFFIVNLFCNCNSITV